MADFDLEELNDEDRVAHAEQVKKLELEQERIRDGLAFVLESKQGRELVWRLLEKCSVYHQSFVGEFPLTNAFNEGRRSVGNWIVEQVFTVGPNAYRLMHEEAWARKQTLEGENG